MISHYKLKKKFSLILPVLFFRLNVNLWPGLKFNFKNILSTKKYLTQNKKKIVYLPTLLSHSHAILNIQLLIGPTHHKQ